MVFLVVLFEERCFPCTTKACPTEVHRQLARGSFVAVDVGRVLRKEAKKIEELLQVVRILKERGLSMEGIIRAYHRRRVALLMSCMLPLYHTGPDARPEGALLAEAPLTPSEIAQRIWDTMGSREGPTKTIRDIVFLVSGCPSMRPEPGFVVFISFQFSSGLLLCFFVLSDCPCTGWCQPEHLGLMEHLVPF